MQKSFPSLLTLGLLLWVGISCAQTAAEIVGFDEAGCLRYQADAENNYIPDFSHAGYQNGDVPLPDVPTVLTIQAIEGDNTAHIQAGLDSVARRAPDANGYRGALLLGPGDYDVSGRLFIRAGGMVLRGSGQGGDPAMNTVIHGLGNVPALRDLIIVSGPNNASWTAEVAGTRTNVTSPFVPAGSRSLEVAAAEFYRAGDNVIVFQPSTVEWLASIDNGATGSDDSWTPGEIDIYYNRVITDVNIAESKITLDAPIFDHLDRNLAQSVVYTLNSDAQLREVGIENLRIDIESIDEVDEDHARNAIFMEGVEDCWISDVTALHFSYALVDMKTANRVTVTGCSGLEPHSPVLGGRRYNFNVSSFSNNILFTDNAASDGRHSFVSNGTSTASGIVFTNSVSDNDRNPSEGHRRWSQGLLFDRIDFRDSETRNLIGLYNRGDFGTGHGWASTNSVAWNVRTPSTRGIIIQKPPARQNYAVGCFSNVAGSLGPFTHPEGYIELTNTALEIPSLYTAQLEQRRDKGVPPDAPAVFTIANTGNELVLNWLDIASREEGYEVEVSDDGGESVVLATLPPNATSYTTPLPLGTGDFTYRVYAIGENCPSPFSNPVTVQGLNSVREAAAGDFTLLPNPVTNQLSIHSAEPYEELRVYNAEGRLIQRYGSQTTLDTSAWAPGFYYLKIKTTEGAYRSVRLVKD